MIKKKKSSKETEINDITALRAFLMPDLFPFLLENYLKNDKTENTLNEDIKKARECYKQLVSLSKQKVSKNLEKV